MAGVREGLLAYELWGGLTSGEMKRRIATLKAKGLAYEDLWIDAGWYGESEKCDDAYTGDWSRWTGDWTPNRRVHPDGLADVAAAALSRLDPPDREGVAEIRHITGLYRLWDELLDRFPKMLNHKAGVLA
ncbi:MAG: hypothetical protein IJP66_08520 [Kiritimatiellae bacterium]|nr:hypothetical protein [Kiritimatiellia bacterium]